MDRSRTLPGQVNLHRRGEGSGLPFTWQYLLLALIVALAAAVRCTTLSFQSLWLDEVHTVLEAGRPWGELFLALLTPQQGYPLYILAMRLWIALFGTGEVALRLPSALAGTVTVPLLYLLGRRTFGRTAGLLAAAFLALSPLAVWYSQEARSYALFLLVTVAAWLLLWEAVERPARWRWWALAGLTAMALSIHRLAILSVVGQLVYIVYIARQGHLTRRYSVSGQESDSIADSAQQAMVRSLSERRYRLLLLGLLALALLLTVAGLWFTLGREGGGGQFSTQRDWRDLASTFTQFSLRIPPGPPEPPMGIDRRPWLILFGVTALAGLAALVEGIVARAAHRRRAVFLLCFLAVPLGIFYLLYLIRPFYYERYLLGVLPAYLLLLAVGVVQMAKWVGRPGSRFTLHVSRLKLLAGAVFLLLGLLTLATALGILASSWQQVQDWTFSRLPQKEQYREATRYLQEHAHPGDLVVIYPGYIEPAVDLYAERFPRIQLELHTITDTATVNYGFREFEDTMGRLARGRRRACLLYAPYHAQTQEHGYWAYEWFYLNEKFLLCDEQHWTGLDLYCISFNAEYRGYMPRPAVPLDARFGEELLLWGANLEPFQEPLWPGDTLPVTLYLEGLQPNLPAIEGVVRLLGGDGGPVWAEEARQPLGGHQPTSMWVAGDEFLDYHELLLPVDIPPGTYTVVVGFRYADAPAEMLPLPGDSDWVELGTVEVVPGGTP